MPIQSTYSLQPDLGYPGQLDRNAPNVILTMQNAEASAQIRMGAAVKRKAAATTDLQAVLPAAEGDTVLGLVVREQTYAPSYTTNDGTTVGDLGSEGLLPGKLMNVAVSGRMLVHVRTGCTAGQRAWVRAVSGGAPEYLGAIENADDSTDTIDIRPFAIFETSCAANGLAWLRFDFTNSGT
jgi:hypothetical protein